MPDTTMRISPVAAPIRAQVTENLRQAIIARRFEPGQRLIERELCELTGVSRTPVREALRQLESEGLVNIVPNRGPVVAEITAEQAAEIYDVRAALEALAARRFAERATDEEARALDAAVDRIEHAMNEDGLTSLLELKDEFYDVLIEGARNRIIRSMLDPLHTRISYLRAGSMSQSGRPAETVSELRAIVAAITAREPGRAAELARLHVERAGELALRSLGEDLDSTSRDGSRTG